MPETYFSRPPNLLSGFHVELPDPDVPELLQTGEQWASRRLLITSHSHTVWEFYLQISGQSCWDGPERSYTLTPGCFFAAPPEMLHRMHDQPDDKHHFFYAAFDVTASLSRLSTTQPFWPEDKIVFLTSAETLLVPFRHLIREVSLSLPHRASGIRLALDALVLEALRLHGSGLTPDLSHALRHPAVRQAKELLDYQPTRPWRLADLSRLTGVSAHHLVECFTRDVGVSPRQYLLSVRIQTAREMLVSTDIAITELALELGFSSSQHFAATFKRLTGETAAGYRGRMGGIGYTSKTQYPVCL